MNDLLAAMQPQQTSNLNPMSILQQMQAYQGTPEQAKQQFFQQAEQMGMSQDQVNEFLNNVQNMGKSMGIL